MNKRRVEYTHRGCRRIVELYWESGSSRQQPAGVATSLPAPANNRRGSEARVSQATAGYERVRVVGKGLLIGIWLSSTIQ